MKCVHEGTWTEAAFHRISTVINRGVISCLESRYWLFSCLLLGLVFIFFVSFKLLRETILRNDGVNGLWLINLPAYLRSDPRMKGQSPGTCWPPAVNRRLSILLVDDASSFFLLTNSILSRRPVRLKRFPGMDRWIVAFRRAGAPGCRCFLFSDRGKLFVEVVGGGFPVLSLRGGDNLTCKRRSFAPRAG